MIYDCFTFFNEFDILEIRFIELYDVVDKFVIVEANETHSRQPKEFFFEKNCNRYEQKFLDKVIHIKTYFTDLSKGQSRWIYENFQRNEIMRGLVNCSHDDIIIISDVDEIPKKDIFLPPEIEGIKSILKYSVDHILLIQSPRYFYFNYQQPDYYWFGSVITSFNKLTNEKTPQYYRDKRGYTPAMLYNSGWHLTYMADIENIRYKLQSFAHAEYSGNEFTNDEKLNKCLEKGIMFTDENIKLEYIPIENCDLPQYVKQNLDKFDKYIKKR